MGMFNYGSPMEVQREMPGALQGHMSASEYQSFKNEMDGHFEVAHFRSDSFQSKARSWWRIGKALQALKGVLLFSPSVPFIVIATSNPCGDPENGPKAHSYKCSCDCIYSDDCRFGCPNCEVPSYGWGCKAKDPNRTDGTDEALGKLATVTVPICAAVAICLLIASCYAGNRVARFASEASEECLINAKATCDRMTSRHSNLTFHLKQTDQFGYRGSRMVTWHIEVSFGQA